jgi:nucleolar protein 9
MPREIRKRGKKKKTQPEEKWNDGSQQDKTYQPESVPVASIEPQAGPSWMRDAPARAGPSGDSTADAEAPFGYVDAEVKAYFRTVDLKLREWQDGNEGDVAPEGVDPNEGKCPFNCLCCQQLTKLEIRTQDLCSRRSQ